MATHTARLLAASMFGFVLMSAAQSRADDMKRIRTDSAYLQVLVADAGDRSPTLRAIIQQIEASDVIVHVTCEHLNSATLQGRTMWASASPGVRYLRVQVECMISRLELVAILGHELQHVAEIAAASDVVDRRSFARLYSTIGFSTCRIAEQYETNGAIRAGERVRQEFVSGKRAVTPRLTAAP
jgi:hypothetical protein